MLAVAGEMGIEAEWIPRIATGFCGGVSRSSSLCGAVSGGVMSLGLELGRDHPEESVETCYAAVRQLQSRFLERFGALNCHELTGCDLATPEGQISFKETGQKHRCQQYSEGAAAIVVELLDGV